MTDSRGGDVSPSTAYQRRELSQQRGLGEGILQGTWLVRNSGISVNAK
ncbi:MAG: hypothetical protein U0795_23010 [Pirellulales bacterium]